MDKEYWIRYHNKLKIEFMELLGGICVKCGSKEDLEFDHIDPSTKKFNITKFPYGKKKLLEELKKCQLLCVECHKSKSHPDYFPNKHGTTRYRNGCRCLICKEAKNNYYSNWRRSQVGQGIDLQN